MKTRRLISIIALLLSLVMCFASCDILSETPIGGLFSSDGPAPDTDPQPPADPGTGDDGSGDNGSGGSDTGDNGTGNPSDEIYDTPSGRPDDTDYPADGENSVARESYQALTSIPEYSGEYYTVLNNNRPYFLKSDLGRVSYAYYSEFDSLGRAGMAVACIGRDLLPTGSRKDPSYNPTGWVQATYSSDLVTGGSIWNRSHLIAWSLADDSGKYNLVTATPYLNQLGMTAFEDMVRDYIKETGNHVLYRVVPVFVGNELVCRGITIEAFSIEDNGGLDTPEASDGICFNNFLHNVKPGIDIDYATGKTSIAEGYDPDGGDHSDCTYVLHATKHKIHLPDCSSVGTMSESNKIYSTKTLEEIVADYNARGVNWSYCGSCHPENQ